MAKQNNLQKELTDTGAVTTNDKAGRLLYAEFIGATAGDKLEIKDGATVVKTLITVTANELVKFGPFKREEAPIFETDIDTTFTKTANAWAYFLYDELT